MPKGTGTEANISSDKLLQDVADFFEKEGKLPAGNPHYVRKPDPLQK